MGETRHFPGRRSVIGFCRITWTRGEEEGERCELPSVNLVDLRLS